MLGTDDLPDLELYSADSDFAAADRPCADPVGALDSTALGRIPGNDSLAGLAAMAGVSRLAELAALSAAPTGGAPANTIEEMLAHELVAGHAFAMNVLGQANNQFLGAGSRAADFDHLVRINRTTAETGLVGVRMMEAVQRGVLALDQLRHGIRYSHVVTRLAAPAQKTAE